MGHVMEVDQEVWQWGQQVSGKINPAPWLRGLLRREMIEGQYQPALSAEVPAKAAASLDGDDPGTVITTERESVCSSCFKLIKTGERALFRQNSRGKRETHHLGHFE